MRKLDRLPVYQTADEIGQAVTDFLRDRAPLPDPHQHVLAITAERHRSVASMAQALPLLEHFSHWADRAYLVEGNSRSARAAEGISAERAMRLCIRLQNANLQAPLGERDFVDLAMDGEDTAGRRHSICDSSALMAGYSMRGFDRRGDLTARDEPEREAEQINEIRWRSARHETTVLRGGSYHASEWLDAMSGERGVKALCVAEVTDPRSDDLEAIDRLDALLSNPHCLVIRSNPLVEQSGIDLRPFVRQALGDPQRLAALLRILERHQDD